MKTIRISKGLITQVSDRDYSELRKFKWTSQRRAHGFHVARYGSNRKYIYMHRQILGITDPKIEGHHRDGDGLNNQRQNLRTTTRQENARAFRVLKGRTSTFRGVAWHKGARKWRAYIGLNRAHIHLGLFKTEQEAAKAYDKAARRMFGCFVEPNFSPS